jgi:hypothetical protein
MSEKKTRDAFRNRENAIKYSFYSAVAAVFILEAA